MQTRSAAVPRLYFLAKFSLFADTERMNGEYEDYDGVLVDEEEIARRIIADMSKVAERSARLRRLTRRNDGNHKNGKDTGDVPENQERGRVDGRGE